MVLIYLLLIVFKKTKKQSFKYQHWWSLTSLQTNSTTIKIASIKLDKRFLWSQLIKLLKNTIFPGLNIVKIILHYTWGSKVHIIIWLYKSLILSKFNYDTFIWHYYYKSSIRKLNFSLRISIDANRSNLIPSIHNLSYFFTKKNNH